MATEILSSLCRVARLDERPLPASWRQRSPARAAPINLSTCLGDNGYDAGLGIALDPTDNAWVTGVTVNGTLACVSPAKVTRFPFARCLLIIGSDVPDRENDSAGAVPGPGVSPGTVANTEPARAPVAPLARGTTIRRYVVLDRIGAGGMGVVYAAYDYGLDRRIALKLVRDSGGAVARTRLIREAQALARLSHPNVVAVYDVGEHDGEVYVAMELVDGTSLRGWLAEAPRDWRSVLGVFLRAGAGLAAAHGLAASRFRR